jgi:ABC-type molybdate transport system substrate-binding protein
MAKKLDSASKDKKCDLFISLSTECLQQIIDTGNQSNREVVIVSIIGISLQLSVQLTVNGWRPTAAANHRTDF